MPQSGHRNWPNDRVGPLSNAREKERQGFAPRSVATDCLFAVLSVQFGGNRRDLSDRRNGFTRALADLHFHKRSPEIAASALKLARVAPVHILWGHCRIILFAIFREQSFDT